MLLLVKYLDNLLCFLLHYDYGGVVTRVTRRVPLVEQELLIHVRST